MSGRWSVAAGESIAGRYVVVGEIGRGGMGSVYEAFDSKLERTVALKFLDPRLQEHAEAVSRFQREALAAGRIGHENICDVRDRGETSEGTSYIVMERLEGQPLSNIMKPGVQLDPIRICRLIIQVLSALGAAHKARIVHRDLKPENIFVTINSEGEERIKILDFGISKFLTESVGKRLTRTGTVMGSPLYMSPEQGRGRTDIDDRTDLWSVGVILFEALTGQVPFDGQNYNEIIVTIVTTDPVEPKVHVPDIDEQIEAVVMRALEKRRPQRFQTAVEFSDAIKAALEGKLDPSLLVSARPPDPFDDDEDAPERDVVISDAAVDVSGDGVTVAAFPETIVNEDEPSGPASPPTVSEIGDSELQIAVAPPRRWLVPVIVVVFLAVAGIGAAVGLTVGEPPAAADSQEVTEPPAGTAVAKTAPPPARGRDSGPTAQTDAAGAASELIGVKLLGVPEGAAVTFDGEAVGSTDFKASPGHSGVLEVSAEGHEPLRLDVTVAENTVVNVAEKLRRLPDGERESRNGRSRTREPRESTRADSQPAEPTPATADSGDSSRAVKGRFGTRVDIEYPGAGTTGSNTDSGRRNDGNVIKGAHGTRVSTDYPE